MKTIAILPNTNKDKNLIYTKEAVEILHKNARIITDNSYGIPHAEVVSADRLMEEADMFIALTEQCSGFRHLHQKKVSRYLV